MTEKSGFEVQQPILVPLMTVDAFASACGISPGVLAAQIDRGYWATMKIGKYRFVNVAALWQQCAAQEY
jgi:hypothetical protein